MPHPHPNPIKMRESELLEGNEGEIVFFYVKEKNSDTKRGLSEKRQLLATSPQTAFPKFPAPIIAQIQKIPYFCFH